MLKKVTLATGLLLALAAPAFADCAEDIAKVEAALATAQISDADKAAITEAVAKAKEQTGDADACKATLADAMTALNLN